MARCDYCKNRLPENLDYDDRYFHKSGECLKHVEFTRGFNQ